MDLIKQEKKGKELSSYLDWSMLSPDILRKIFETLSPIDSHHSKTVCSSWYSVWKTCKNLPPCPLMRIIHQGDDSSSSLFRPEAEQRPKLVRCLPSKGYCMASSESWLLMVDYRLDFHLLNILNRERINLPPILGGKRSGFIHGTSRMDFLSNDIIEWKHSAVLWINEATGYYVVAWVYRQHYLFIHKKGQDSWKRLHGDNKSGFVDVAYRNNSLYIFTTDNHIRIFDISIDRPVEIKTNNPYRYCPFRFDEKPWEYVWKRKIAIDKTGEVLVILSLKDVWKAEKLLFYVFKMNPKSCKWERVHSLGDEMLIFGRGVTMRAPVRDFGDGIKRDSIYFVGDDVWPDHQDGDHPTPDCGVFDITTSRIEWPERSCFYINKSQWFVPGLAL